MKRYSTVIFALMFASTAALGGQSNCTFLSNAPDQHVVVNGDTLWGVSGKFLEHPWCWPQVWGMNNEQIRNPHKIYPGQVVHLNRTTGQLSLGTSPVSGEPPLVVLSPKTRAKNLEREAIPAIPPDQIEPFLTQPLIVAEDELTTAPRVVATQEGRVNLGKGDKAYVLGNLGGVHTFQVFRPGSALKDPETGQVIGYEAVYLGVVKLQRAATAEGEVHTFVIVRSKEEIGSGDRLLPVPPISERSYVPHAPKESLNARVVSVYGGVSQAGQNQLVTINRGRTEGLDVGSVLTLSRFGGVRVDKTVEQGFALMGEQAVVKLPDEEYGTLFVFRVFDNISYGLVMQVTDSVQIGDVAKSPE